MRTGFEGSDIARGQIVVGLAPHDDARLAVAAEDDRRARHAVVVVGHRVAVGAGRGRRPATSPTRVGEPRLLDQDVAGLAVHAGDRRHVSVASPARSAITAS